MNVAMKPLAEVTSGAIEVLIREIGSVNAIIFMYKYV